MLELQVVAATARVAVLESDLAQQIEQTWRSTDSGESELERDELRRNAVPPPPAPPAS